MKHALLFAAGIVIATAPVYALADSIGIYADPAGVSCQLSDGTPGLLSIFVVHIDTPGASASQFSSPVPACMTGVVWLSDTNAFAVTIGDSQNGASIGYGGCLFDPIHILTINVFGQGLSDACCRFGVLADPNQPSGQIEVVDCGGSLAIAGSIAGRVNGDGSCGCADEYQETTWGQVKSIYDNY